MLIVINEGEIYTPEPRGRGAVVIAGSTIAHVGAIDASALEKQLELEVLDASGCIVAPALIDPHVHLLGGSGEEGFGTQTPEVFPSELLRSGIATVVGVLGTDTTTRTMQALLARVKGFREDGLSAYAWAGGYDARPILGCIRDDIVLFDEIIGIGELAIADSRGRHYTARELARFANDCSVAGSFTGKAGVLHLHVGPGRERLRVLRQLLDEFEVLPQTLYPTHMERDEELMTEAIELTRRGVPIDLDVYEEDLARWVVFMREHDVDFRMVTASTDTAINSPATLLAQIREVVEEKLLPLETALSLVTSNTARVLKLKDNGCIAEGMRANVIGLDQETLELRFVVANGRVVMRDGRLTYREKFLKKTNRSIEIRGAGEK